MNTVAGTFIRWHDRMERIRYDHILHFVWWFGRWPDVRFRFLLEAVSDE